MLLNAQLQEANLTVVSRFIYLFIYFNPCGHCAEQKHYRGHRDLRAKHCSTVQEDNNTSWEASQSQASILTLV